MWNGIRSLLRIVIHYFQATPDERTRLIISLARVANIAAILVAGFISLMKRDIIFVSAVVPSFCALLCALLASFSKDKLVRNLGWGFEILLILATTVLGIYYGDLGSKLHLLPALSCAVFLWMIIYCFNHVGDPPHVLRVDDVLQLKVTKDLLLAGNILCIVISAVRGGAALSWAPSIAASFTLAYFLLYALISYDAVDQALRQKEMILILVVGMVFSGIIAIGIVVITRDVTAAVPTSVYASFALFAVLWQRWDKIAPLFGRRISPRKA